jgi:hypothetical protein
MSPLSSSSTTLTGAIERHAVHEGAACLFATLSRLSYLHSELYESAVLFNLSRRIALLLSDGFVLFLPFGKLQFDATNIEKTVSTVCNGVPCSLNVKR